MTGFGVPPLFGPRSRVCGGGGHNRPDEGGDPAHALVHEPVAVISPLDARLDVATPAQAREMTRDPTLSEAGRLDETGHGAGSLGEELQDPHPSRVGKSLEEGREG